MSLIEKPAEGVVRTGDFGHAKSFKVICECTSDDHIVDAWVQLEPDQDVAMIEMEFYVKTWTPIYKNVWSRLKAACNILFKGVDVREHSILLKEQGARNLVAALDTAVKDLEEYRDNK